MGALLNAKKMDVKLLSGQTDIVFLKQLSIRELLEWVTFLSKDQTPELVRLCADKPIEWIDTLSDESYGELVKECFKRNFQRAMTLAEKDPVIAILLAPLTPKVMAVLKIAQDAGVNMKSLLEGHAPSESAAATGSGSSTAPQNA